MQEDEISVRLPARGSALSTGRLAGFSLDHLMRFLMILGHDVTIQASKAKKPMATIRVVTPKTR